MTQLNLYEDYELLYGQAWQLRKLQESLEQAEVERLYAGRLEKAQWEEGEALQQASMATLESRLASTYLEQARESE